MGLLRHRKDVMYIAMWSASHSWHFIPYTTAFWEPAVCLPLYPAISLLNLKACYYDSCIWRIWGRFRTSTPSITNLRGQAAGWTLLSCRPICHLGYVLPACNICSLRRRPHTFLFLNQRPSNPIFLTTLPQPHDGGLIRISSNFGWRRLGCSSKEEEDEEEDEENHKKKNKKRDY